MKRKTAAARDASRQSRKTAETPSPPPVPAPPRARPRLLLAVAVIYTLWLAYLAYVAVQS